MENKLTLGLRRSLSSYRVYEHLTGLPDLAQQSQACPLGRPRRHEVGKQAAPHDIDPPPASYDSNTKDKQTPGQTWPYSAQIRPPRYDASDQT